MARTKRKTSMRGGAKTIKNMKGGMLGGGKSGAYTVSQGNGSGVTYASIRGPKKKKNYTSLSSVGEFGLIERIQSNFDLKNSSSILGIGDDAAVIDSKNKTVVSTDMLVENIHFNLMYVPLKHLGYKSVIVNLSDIFAMNAKPEQITVSLSVSNRFTLEAVDELYSGIKLACEKYKVDLIGGDTTSSEKGLIISITAIGTSEKDRLVYRTGAKKNDLVAVTGNLGAAYMGLQILEREKEVFKVNPQSQPNLDKYTYCIQRQLRPEARHDIFKYFKENKIIPTSMIDISDGLSSEILHISEKSKVGIHIYEDKIPIDNETIKICKEFKLNEMTAALNGGEDYEILFTIDQSDYELVKKSEIVSIIGHVTKIEEGNKLTTSLDQAIDLTAQGWSKI